MESRAKLSTFGKITLIIYCTEEKESTRIDYRDSFGKPLENTLFTEVKGAKTT